MSNYYTQNCKFVRIVHRLKSVALTSIKSRRSTPLSQVMDASTPQLRVKVSTLYTVSWLTFSRASERTTIRHRHNPL
jgi:hypothetical protein